MEKIRGVWRPSGCSAGCVLLALFFLVVAPVGVRAGGLGGAG